MRNRYEPRAPRTMIWLLAVGMTASMLSVFVALPQRLAVANAATARTDDAAVSQSRSCPATTAYLHVLQGVDGTHAVTVQSVWSAAAAERSGGARAGGPRHPGMRSTTA